jgi:L-alanine-DL-glutamate epimerase-like enolase superfamily enzyme
MREAEQTLAEGWLRGYRNFNLKVAPDPKLDLELCRFVKSAASEGFLWLDANGSYDVETALRLAPKFASIGADVLEQPVAANRLSGLRELKQQASPPHPAR